MGFVQNRRGLGNACHDLADHLVDHRPGFCPHVEEDVAARGRHLDVPVTQRNESLQFPGLGFAREESVPGLRAEADGKFQGEGKTLEYKAELPKGKQLAKTLIAFANGSGGKLVIGVDDKRQLIGIKDADFLV